MKMREKFRVGDLLILNKTEGDHAYAYNWIGIVFRVNAKKGLISVYWKWLNGKNHWKKTVYPWEDNALVWQNVRVVP
jgi:hypothetical protein